MAAGRLRPSLADKARFARLREVPVAMALLARIPEGLKPEREYAVRVLLRDILGLDVRLEAGPPGSVRIELAAEPDAGSIEVADVFLARASGAWLSPETVPRSTLSCWEVPSSLGLPGRRIVNGLPVLFGSEVGDGSFCRVGSGRIEFGVDFFGAAFFLLTRYEELASLERDRHGRFPASASLAGRAGLLERPLVNEYAEILWAAMRLLWPRLGRRLARARMCLTHDVDRPFSGDRSFLRTLRSAGADILLRWDPALAGRRLAAVLPSRLCGAVRDPWDTFDWLMDVSERHGERSAFYFLAGRTDARFDADYTMNDPRIRRLLRRIADRGHEVGLHGSYGSYRSAEKVQSEFDVLRRAAQAEGVRQDVWGGRQHYLRWEAPTTWQSWEDAGLAYDSTVGFAEQAGFRAGTCSEYPVFNLRTRSTLRLRERPLALMDVTLLGHNHMHLSHAAAERVAVRITRSCREHRCPPVLLWHNSSVAARGDRAVYERIVGRAAG